jgi:hypothetical protein
VEAGIRNARMQISTESIIQLGFHQKEMEFIGRNFQPTTDLQVSFSLSHSRINSSFRPREARLSPKLLLLQYERDQNFNSCRSKQIAAKYHQLYNILYKIIFSVIIYLFQNVCSKHQFLNTVAQH